MGADALRYFLLREVVFGQDGSFSYDALVDRYNSDLANGLGNLASRTLTMIHQYRKGVVPEGARPEAIAVTAAETIAGRTGTLSSVSSFRKGLETVWALISAVDKYIVERAPWKLAASRTRTSQQASRRDALYRGRSAAHRHRAGCARAAAIRAQDLGAARHAGADRIGALSSCAGATCRPARRSAKWRRSFRASKPPRPSNPCANSKIQATARPGRAARQRRPPPAKRISQNRHRRFRQGRSPRGPGAFRRARQRLRQAHPHEGRSRRAAAAHHRGRHRRSLHARASSFIAK